MDLRKLQEDKDEDVNDSSGSHIMHTPTESIDD